MIWYGLLFFDGSVNMCWLPIKDLKDYIAYPSFFTETLEYVEILSIL